MVFDLIPNLFASVVSILFPVFASYKALRTADPAQLSPWLMYWISFALLTMVETNFSLLLFFVPFYSLMRLVFLFYLILPQTQGAKVLYQTRIHPFLAHHEARIERHISELHARLQGYGLDHLTDAIAWLQRMVLGRQPEPQPAPRSAEGYAASLLARFNLPTAREGVAAPAGDIYGMLSAAAATLGRGMGAAGAGASRDGQIDELARNGGLVPAHITDPHERVSYIGQQRDRLRVVLAALDRQSVELERAANDPSAPTAHTGSMPRSKSEVSFERIDPDEAGDAASTGWFDWVSGGGKGKAEASSPTRLDARGKGSSSGVDTGR